MEEKHPKFGRTETRGAAEKTLSENQSFLKTLCKRREKESLVL
jgi:hypothetical protein